MVTFEILGVLYDMEVAVIDDFDSDRILGIVGRDLLDHLEFRWDGPGGRFQLLRP